ncbi:cytochrome-c peroxidase [Pedobacter panaciterrae]|uniref:Cytochrome c peroxidase n=1 Tax=Pedobacter panaciterrae TaxID=363849 RepID=A0ABU8NFP3_9SPHI
MKAKTKIFGIIAFINLVLFLVAYNIRPIKVNYDAKEVQLKFTVPPNFPQPGSQYDQHFVTPAGFKLGRILFYDRALSIDNSISCASCHQSFSAFSDQNKHVSQGFKQCSGTRNTPALFNLAWQKEFMWDGRVKLFQLSSHNAIINPCEIANSMAGAVEKLRANGHYTDLFRNAYGSVDIDSARLLNALTQFMSMLVSANSRYDKYRRYEQGGVFTTDEKNGYILFRQKCSACHKEPLFTDLSYRNTGLDLVSIDRGRDSSTHLATDVGKFRVPSLRNIEVTAPYMHDGRFATLEDVLTHYANGVKRNTHLDEQLRHNGTLGLALSSSDQHKIIAFLKTLTDKEFLTDVRFQIP